MSSLHDAVVSVSNAIVADRERVSWPEVSEYKVFREVVGAILGSQVSFELALSALDALDRDGALHFDKNVDSYRKRIRSVLLLPLENERWKRPRRYRFPDSKAWSIASTAAAFYGCDTPIKQWLASQPDARVARRELVERAHGLGPKQASMALRNIGFAHTFAVLDAHVLRYMRLTKWMRGLPRTSVLSVYERVEARFLDYASWLGHDVDVVDKAVWVVMRVRNKERA